MDINNEPQPSASGRRYAPLRKRIAAGGGYDEWFLIRAQITMGAAARVQAMEGSDIERGMALAIAMLERWSITELRPRNPAHDPLADGEELTDEQIDAAYERVPVPVSADAFRALPADMVTPVIQAAGAAANFRPAPSPKTNDSPST